MATNSVEVKIRALVEGLQGITKMGGELRKMATEATSAGSSATAGAAGIGKLGEQARRSGEAMREGGQGAVSFKDQLGQIQGGVSMASRALGTLVTVFKAAAAGFVGFTLASQVKQFADAAARAETLGVTLGVVGQNAGYSKEQIAGYEAELRKLGISTVATRDSLTKLIQAGIELTDVNEQGQSTAARLARASQDLAVITGQNSSETFQRLITNIQQMDSMGLRYQGLLVNIQGAQEKFAQSIGKSSGALTQQQKQQAVLNEVLVQATALSGSYEKSLETVGKKLGSLERISQDASVSIGKSLTPVYGVLVDAATDFLKKIDEMATAFNDNSTIAQDFADGLREIVGVVGSLASNAIEFWRKIDFAPIGMALREVGSAILNVIKTLGGMISGLNQVGEGGKIGLLQVVLESIGFILAGVADGVTFLGMVFEGLAAAALIAAHMITKGWGEIVGLFNKDIGDAIKKTADEFEAMAIKAGNSAAKTFQKFADGDTAVARFTENMGKANREMGKIDPTPVEQMEESIRKVTEGMRKHTMNSIESTEALAKLTTQLARMKEEAQLTDKEFATLSIKLANLGKQGQDSFAMIMAGLKTTETELSTGIGAAAAQAGGYLTELAQHGLTTGKVFSEAFRINLDTSKSIADLNVFDNALAAAMESGKLSIEEQGVAVRELQTKFEELFFQQSPALPAPPA